MVNASLSQGRLKHAVVTPLLKKRGLDTSNMANFRLVSNLTLMSKVVERAVAKQLNEHLTVNDLLPRYSRHSGNSIRRKRPYGYCRTH